MQLLAVQALLEQTFSTIQRQKNYSLARLTPTRFHAVLDVHKDVEAEVKLPRNRRKTAKLAIDLHGPALR